MRGRGNTPDPNSALISLCTDPGAAQQLTSRMSATMAQFMDRRVSPMKMKIWGKRGSGFMTVRANTWKVDRVPSSSIN